MADRNLSDGDARLWRRVAATVRPIDPRRPVPVDPAGATRPLAAKSHPAKPDAVELKPHGARTQPVATPPPKSAGRSPPRVPTDTLDGGWDRRLGRGVVQPDRTIDLHGHSLASAHAVLDHALHRALADGMRVLLVVTGKPPAPHSERPHARGAIRAAIGDWLAGSRHADRIAAVRGAHPRHGGQGAIYVILRRLRPIS